MSRLTQQSGDDSRYILVAKLDNARNLLNILKAVHFKEVSLQGSLVLFGIHYVYNNQVHAVVTSIIYQPKFANLILTKIIKLTVKIGCELVKNDYDTQHLSWIRYFFALACMIISGRVCFQLLFQSKIWRTIRKR